MRISYMFLATAALIFQIKTFGQDNAVKFIEDSTRYFIAPININSVNSEFSPVLTNGKLIFASDRTNTLGVVYTNADNSPFLDLFICDRIDSLSFGPVRSLSKTINTAFNDGPAYLSQDQKQLFFSSNSPYTFTLTPDNKVKQNLQLFSSALEKEGWQQPSRLSFCDPEYSYTHPCLLPDEKTLLFSSNRKGGFGGMDLYYSRNENGVWTEPKNLGSKINSTANELFPFVSAEGTIYFSSDGPNGFGGLDIYSMVLADSSVSQKQLMEMPINSAQDDFGINVAPSGKQGYLSSNRNQSRKDDIYFFSNKYSSISECTPFVAPSFCFTFYEESTENNLQDAETAKLEYEWDLGDGTKIKNKEAKHCFRKPGKYNVELNIVEEASGALFYNEASFEFTVEDSEQVYIESPDTATINSPIKISAERSKLPGCTILSAEWDFGDGRYSSGLSGTRTYKKAGKYAIQLGIQFRNDSTGKTSRLCIEKEIQIITELWKNAGETRFVKPTNKEEKFSTGNHDSLNYRVFLGSSSTQVDTNTAAFEGLTDIKEIQRDSLFLYTSGQEKRVMMLTPEFKAAKQNGFTNAQVVAFSSDSLIENQDGAMNAKIPDSLNQLPPLPRPEAGECVVLFGFNEYSVKKEYYKSLDSLAEILKVNSDYKASVFAFADTVGNDSYNLKLSEKRADAVKQYLVRSGVKARRIHEIPFGEHRDLNNEMNLLHQENKRRVSIKLEKKQK